MSKHRITPWGREVTLVNTEQLYPHYSLRRFYFAPRMRTAWQQSDETYTLYVEIGKLVCVTSRSMKGKRTKVYLSEGDAMQLQNHWHWLGAEGEGTMCFVVGEGHEKGDMEEDPSEPAGPMDRGLLTVDKRRTKMPKFRNEMEA